jgi:dipeptidyl aminopeptidase/acylaminoacyl peptidase
VNFFRNGFLVLLSSALTCVALGQSASQLAMSETGVDVGFDPTPVEIPAVARIAPRPVTSMDLLTLRDFHGMQISPDGRFVAFVLGQAVYAINSYRSGLFVIGAQEGSQAVSLGTAGVPRWDEVNQWVPEDPQWSPDSRHIYRTMKAAGSWQVWRWDREGGGPPLQVTRTKHDVQSFFLSPDGKQMLLLLTTPPAVDKKKLAEEGILYDGSFQATAQSLLDRVAAKPGGESETWIQDLQSGDAHKASAAEISGLSLAADTVHDPLGTAFRKVFTQKEIDDLYILSFAISPDRKKVAYARVIDNSSEAEWRSFPLLVRPLHGGAPLTVASWATDWDQFWWSSDSKEIYYAANSQADPNFPHESKLMAVPADGGKPRLVLESHGTVLSYSADRSGHSVACTFEDNTNPAKLMLGDLSAGELRTLVDVNPELHNLQINPAKRIEVTAKDGLPFWGHLVLPLGYEPGKRYPLVITTYRDDEAFLRGAAGDEYPIHVFAANGFTVLNFDAMGRTDRTGKPGDFDRTLRMYQGPLEAIEAAITKLSDMGIVDRSRVAITGLSGGAILTNYAISHTNLFHAAIDSGYGSFDPIIYYLLDDNFRSSEMENWFNLGRPEGDMLARYQKISVALNATNVHTPLLINAAEGEYITDMQRITTLRDLKKPVEMYIYPGERHGKNQPKHRYEIYQRNVDWLNFWLRDKEDPDPAKAEQYKRWRELRSLGEKDQQQAVAQKR